jgi:hypothetical protein
MTGWKHWFLSLLLGAGGALLAQVHITGVPAQGLVPCGSTLRLKVTAEDGRAGHWRWTLGGDPGPTLDVAEGDSVTLKLPPSPLELEAAVRVEDRDDPLRSTQVALHLVPWALAPVAGSFGPPAEGQPGPFHDVFAVRFVEDPAMAEFYRGWLVADSKGLWFVDPAHQVRPVLDNAALEAKAEAWLHRPFKARGGLRLSAVAVRPPQSAESSPWHVVLAAQNYASAARDDGGTFLFTLDPDGSLRCVAGRPRNEETRANDARGPMARAVLPYPDFFHLDRAGRLYLGIPFRENKIVFIAPDGTVASFWPLTRAEDTSDWSNFIGSLDPASGWLYLSAIGPRSQRHSFQVDPQASAAHPRGRATRIPAHIPSRQGRDLELRPMDFLVSEGRLFVLNQESGRHSRQILVIDPATWTGEALVDPPESRDLLPRFGIFPPFAPPGARPEDSADLGNTIQLCPGPGHALVMAVRGSPEIDWRLPSQGGPDGLIMIPGGLRMVVPGQPAGPAAAAAP